MFDSKHDKMTNVIRRHWNARARTFDLEAGHGMHSLEQHKAWIQLLARLAGNPPKRVLDVGCGTGVLTTMFAELGHRVTGIDLAVRMLDVAREKARDANLHIEYRLEDACNLSDADSSYELVVARHVIWTLPDPDRGVREWLRVLQPAGRLAFIEGKWAHNEAVAQYFRSIKGRITAALTDAAFAVMASLSRRNRRKLNSRQYQRIQSQLPFSGGSPKEKLMDFLEARGLHDVTTEPLMSPVLWGQVPPFPRYLVVGTR